MDEELAKILEDESLDNTAKAEAIKTYVGSSFVPTKKYADNKKAQTEAYNALKNEYETFKQSKMTDEEKQAEAIRIEKEKTSKQSKMLSQLFAENTFSKAGFKEEDYKDIIPNIIQEDPEATKSLASVICNTMLNQKKAIENQVKEQIIKGQKKPEGGEDPEDGVTQIEKYKKAYEEAQKNGDMVAMANYTMLISQAQNK